jgi:hypothetical protein
VSRTGLTADQTPAILCSNFMKFDDMVNKPCPKSHSGSPSSVPFSRTPMAHARARGRTLSSPMPTWSICWPRSPTSISSAVRALLRTNGMPSNLKRGFSLTGSKEVRAVADLRGVLRRTVVYPHGPGPRTLVGTGVSPFQHFARSSPTASL